MKEFFLRGDWELIMWIGSLVIGAILTVILNKRKRVQGSALLRRYIRCALGGAAGLFLFRWFVSFFLDGDVREMTFGVALFIGVVACIFLVMYAFFYSEEGDPLENIEKMLKERFYGPSKRK